MTKLDERSQGDNTADIMLVQKDIEYIKLQLTEINHKLDNEYVTRNEFAPIQKLVYGGVSITLVAVVTALLALVITK